MDNVTTVVEINNTDETSTETMTVNETTLEPVDYVIVNID